MGSKGVASANTACLKKLPVAPRLSDLHIDANLTGVVKELQTAEISI